MADEPAVPRGGGREACVQALTAFGIDLSTDELDRLARFLELLLDANTRMNLTAVRDVDAAWMRHVFDALTLLPILQQADARRVADVGSGGGVPGLVLAVVWPQATHLLIETTGKKAAFLRGAADALSLRSVEVRSERAESLGRGPLRETIDVVTARAVARLPILLELCLPLVREHGHMVTIKGAQASAEVAESARALGTLRGAVTDSIRTPTGTVLVIEKVGKTPRRYPRGAGEPQKSPL
ncbi:MAG: 16S rRNA (guanine(527)-N(7))-methyltransferase RsmG [Planctomycetes bacterium]|nr:16S rRNA (guanine(527)-N(7))-methyltransferase RsmG [Planctomycetota bacterium]